MLFFGKLSMILTLLTISIQPVIHTVCPNHKFNTSILLNVCSRYFIRCWSGQERSLLPEVPRNPREPTCPFASRVEVVEDRGVLMEVPNGYNGPNWVLGIISCKLTPPWNASKPLQPQQGTCLSLYLPSWSCGGQVSWWLQWTHRVIGNNGQPRQNRKRKKNISLLPLYRLFNPLFILTYSILDRNFL